jgi:guanylate kinase
MKHQLSEEIDLQRKRNVLLVLTGPTGAGKDTVFKQMLNDTPSLVKIITTSSRKMRESEQEGSPYFFLSRDVFEQKIAEHAFFEWVEFRGELYGTQKQTLEDSLHSGKDIIWHIDTRGVKNIKQKVSEMTDRAVFVFLTAPIDVLRNRVQHDEGEVGFEERWHEPLVKWEMEQYDDCDYLVINEQEKLQETVRKIWSIMEAKRLEINK